MTTARAIRNPAVCDVELTNAEWESITHLLATRRMRTLVHEHDDAYCGEGCAERGLLRDAINSVIASRSDNSSSTSFSRFKPGIVDKRRLLAATLRALAAEGGDILTAEFRESILAATGCALLPNEGSETCLSQGIGRDRACSDCRALGWGDER